MKKLIIKLFVVFFLTSCSFAFVEQQEAFKNDYLYSEEYFDYLIECAEQEKLEQQEAQKALLEENKVKNKKNTDKNDIIEAEINKDEADDIAQTEPEFISAELEPFKLRIIEHSMVSPYSESYKTVSTKTTIPVGSSVSFIQNLTTTRNKYSSNDYKILAGAEINPFKCFRISTGLETNYRGVDQAPSSRKIYFSPAVYFNDVFSLTFHNKININSYSTDHDIGLNLSPFKSKALDFGVYAGITRNNSGALSESVNFSTTFYFF